MNYENDIEPALKKMGAEPGLDPAEFTRIRGFLTTYMEEHPMLEREDDIPSPYYSIFSNVTASLSKPFVYGMSLLLIVVVGTGGVAFAAEGTIPGDLLYPVKVDIVEPLGTALTFSASARSARYAMLAERRLSEATLLADKGQLSTSTETMLATQFALDANAVATSSAPSDFAANLSLYEITFEHLESQKGSGVLTPLVSSIDTEINLHSSTSSLETNTDGEAGGSPSFVGSLQNILNTSSSVGNSDTLSTSSPSGLDTTSNSTQLNVCVRAATNLLGGISSNNCVNQKGTSDVQTTYSHAPQSEQNLDLPNNAPTAPATKLPSTSPQPLQTVDSSTTTATISHSSNESTSARIQSSGSTSIAPVPIKISSPSTPINPPPITTSQ